MLRKFDDVYVGLFFNNGDSVLFDDVGTVFVDSIIKHPACEEALKYAAQFFEGAEIEELTSDFYEFVDCLLEMGVLEEGSGKIDS